MRTLPTVGNVIANGLLMVILLGVIALPATSIGLVYTNSLTKDSQAPEVLSAQDEVPTAENTTGEIQLPDRSYIDYYARIGKLKELMESEGGEVQSTQSTNSPAEPEK